MLTNVILPTELDYAIAVYTGDKMGAGTDSNVFTTLYGENGDSGNIPHFILILIMILDLRIIGTLLCLAGDHPSRNSCAKLMKCYKP